MGREETVKFIIESGKSVISSREEIGIDKNTVCRWIRDYKRKYNLFGHPQKGIYLQKRLCYYLRNKT